jgi:hypothetical protein
LIACAALWGLNPTSDFLDETVDLIEINHFHDDEGRPLFDQVLFYDWSNEHGRYQVRDWRLLKSIHQVPLPSAREREFIAVWNDSKLRDTLRATKAKIVRESWTQYDPELVEREFLPEHKRRKLMHVPARHQPAAAELRDSGRDARPMPLIPLQTPAPRPTRD